MFKRFKENSGFGLDEKMGLPTAVEGVWAEYSSKHPEGAM